MNFLVDRGLGPDDRVAVTGTQRLEPLVAHLAAFEDGAVSVPVSALLDADGLEYRPNHSDASAFVVDRGSVDAPGRIRDDLDALDLVVTTESFEPEAFDDGGDGCSREPALFDRSVRQSPRTTGVGCPLHLILCRSVRDSDVFPTVGHGHGSGMLGPSDSSDGP